MLERPKRLLTIAAQGRLTLPLEGPGRLSSRIGGAIEAVNNRISSAAGAREAVDNRTSSAGVAREVGNYRTNTARGDEMLLISGAAMLEGA